MACLMTDGMFNTIELLFWRYTKYIGRMTHLTLDENQLIEFSTILNNIYSVTVSARIINMLSNKPILASTMLVKDSYDVIKNNQHNEHEK